MSKVHKYDSTRGKSAVNPQNYKRDELMQVWLQSRHLATLLKWLEKNGRFVRFKSEIVQLTLEEVVEHIISTGEVEMVEFAEDAKDILKRFGVNSNPSNRGKKNVFHNEILDNRRKDNSCNLNYAEHSQPPKSSITNNNNENFQGKSLDQWIKEGNALYEAKEKAKRMESYKKANDDMMANIKVDENGVVIQPDWTDEQCGRCGQKFKDEVDERNERQNKIADREAEDERKRKKEIKEKNKKDKKREKLLSELNDLDKNEEKEKLISEKPNVEDDRMRTRSYEEILEDRIKKDKIQENKLKALDTIPRRQSNGN